MNRTVGTVIAALAVVARALYAGPLDPPAGPIAPSYKTLTQVEPRTAINATNTPGDGDSLFKITQPGSYYLTGNITGVVGKHGIEIVASGVTLDLMGFDLAGVPAMGAFDGVSVTLFFLSNFAVVNGSVRNWGGDGVDLSKASNYRLADLLASGNAGDGIVSGGGGTVTSCSAYLNLGNGISIGSSTCSNCSAYDNSGNGINASGATILHCSAYQNEGSGISAHSDCVVADCISTANNMDGIVCVFACLIRGNTCVDNGNAGFGAGIHAIGTNNRLEGNNCTSSDRGILVDDPGNIIIRNTCSANTVSWSVAAGNVILVVNGIGAPSVFGTAGGAAPGSSDPNANFSF